MTLTMEYNNHFVMTTILKVSLSLNLVVFVYLFLNTESISRQRTDLSRRRSLLKFSWNEPIKPQIIRVTKSEPETIVEPSCRKSILLFGMKEHWKEFCLFDEMLRFRNLVVFPRDIQCPEIPYCNVTLSYSEEPKEIQRADLVVFTNIYAWLTHEKWDWVHGNRSSDKQPWTMITLDSPLYVPGLEPPIQYVDSTYSWIASYKPDSDLYLPYGSYQPYDSFTKPRENLDLKTILQNKTKHLAWMGSNCKTSQWDRQRLVRDIQKQLKTDLYGACGSMEIPWNDRKTMMEILGQYKFYLSFENSCCDDYISEKFWRALDLGIVPVVVGASVEQYKRVAPPNSFIHVGEFSSLTELLKTILIIGTDDAKYLKYFQWRNEGKIIVNSQEDHYVTPLKDETHCSLLQKYLAFNNSAEHKRLDFKGPRWAGSCNRCGEEGHWIQNYMKPKES